MKDKNTTANLQNLNPFNYFTIWITIWFLLFINNIIKYNPFITYVAMIYPTLYMLYMYIRYNDDKLYKQFSVISFSLLTHYVPLIYLFLTYGVKFTIAELFIYLILMNLYLIYVKKNNLTVNKIYNDIYFKNELI